jgi:hypothetical protein
VRQPAAALQLGLMQMIAGNWAIHKGASKPAHSKGYAFEKKYAAIGETRPEGLEMEGIEWRK